jgi:hypothetical protein
MRPWERFFSVENTVCARCVEQAADAILTDLLDIVAAR